MVLPPAVYAVAAEVNLGIGRSVVSGIKVPNMFKQLVGSG
jgi:hypothetical protein